MTGFRDNAPALDGKIGEFYGVDPVIIERLGLKLCYETTAVQDHLNGNQMAETAIRVVTVADDQGQFAWLITACEDCYPLHHPKSNELDDWIDEIIALAKLEKVRLLVPIDRVTFDYNRETSPKTPMNQSQPREAKRFRDRLIKKYDFVSVGPTTNGYAEILCMPTAKPKLSLEGLPTELKELLDGIELRLLEAADLEWFDRATRKAVAALKTMLATSS